MYIDQSVAGLKYKMCVPGSKFHWAGLQGIFFAVSSVPALDLGASLFVRRSARSKVFSRGGHQRSCTSRRPRCLMLPENPLFFKEFALSLPCAPSTFVGGGVNLDLLHGR